MINVQSSGTHFDWLVGYLLGQERATEQERVAWIATRNLPTDDAALAATFMRATAAQSHLVQKPVYQIVLSFAPDDPVDRALMERVADRVLQRVGLGEHQAILVAHCDRPHPHVHVIVNRVHPETGQVWATWNDWRRVRQVVSEEELALGLRQVPSRLLRVDALAHDVRTYERVVDLTRAQYRAESEANAASARATRWQLDAETARNARARCERALGRVYGDPDRARRAYQAVADRDGVDAATRRMRERPEEFGALVAVEQRGALGLWHAADDRRRSLRLGVLGRRSTESSTCSTRSPERPARPSSASRPNAAWSRLAQRCASDLRLSVPSAQPRVRRLARSKRRRGEPPLAESKPSKREPSRAQPIHSGALRGAPPHRRPRAGRSTERGHGWPRFGRSSEACLSRLSSSAASPMG